MTKEKIVNKKKAVTKKAAPKPEFSSSIPVFDVKGKEVERFQLDKELFTGKVNKAVLYQAVLMYSACARQGNAATKTRGDVSGGGKKPFRQKGTGRARAGSTRSPLWRHGGTVFGPQPRDYRYDMPKKLKRAAFLSSINSKLADSRMIGILEVSVSEPKTKNFRELLSALKLDGKSLFVVDAVDRNVIRASRNMREVSVKNYKDFNTMDVLYCDNLVISKPALEKLPGRLN
jgi:large subunit ribosomal protein L4